MLRRKTDNTFEFRDIERALYGAAPHSLSAERREALRARIFSELGAQDVPRRSFGDIASERWITIPVGASIAASVIAATNYLLDPQDSRTETTWVATAAGSVTVDGVDGPTAEPGQRIEATGPSWVAVGKDVRVGLEAGSALRFASSGDRLALLLEAGTHHIVSQEPLLEVRGQRWTARMTGPGALEVSMHEWYSSLVALEGETIVHFAGNTYLLRPGDRPLLLLAQPPDAPGSGPHTGDSGPAPVQGGGNPNPGPSAATEPDHGSRRENQPPASAPANGLAGPASGNEGSSESAPGEGAAAPSKADTPPGPPAGVPPSAPPPAEPPPVNPPPADPPAGQPEAPPPASPPQAPGNGNGNGSPPSSPGAGSGNNGNGLGNTGEHPHGGPPGLEPEGNSTAGANGNAGGQGNGNSGPPGPLAAESSPAASTPPANPTTSPRRGTYSYSLAVQVSSDASSDAGGNSEENASPNSNAGGNPKENALPNSNAGGNSEEHPSPNSNAGGNSEEHPSPNSNAAGNSEGNASPHSNAGGNSEGNASPHSNAGGNSEENGSLNSNAGGNSEEHGSPDSNAGGNGRQK